MAALRDTRSVRLASIVVLSIVLLDGCATSRAILDVRTAEAANPEQGTALRVDSVVDARQFSPNPPEANLPSLKQEDIDNVAIKSRAIARKRNGFGKALGDVLLSEGRTVQDLTREAVTGGLRNGGYRVLRATDDGYAEATPVVVTIDKFWGWLRPGFWQIALEFELAITVTANVEPFTDGQKFTGASRREGQAATNDAWLEAAEQGLSSLEQNIAAGLSSHPKSP